MIRPSRFAELTRREFLHSTGSVAALAAGGSLLAACGGREPAKARASAAGPASTAQRKQAAASATRPSREHSAPRISAASAATCTGRKADGCA